MLPAFSKTSFPKTGAVAIVCYEEDGLPAAGKELDGATDGALTRAMKAGDFSGKKGQSLDILAPAGVKLSRIVLLGAGPAADFTALGAEALGGAAAAHVAARKETAVAICLDGADGDLPAGEAAARVALGARLKTYRFDRYKSDEGDEKKPALKKVAVHTSAAADAKKRYAALDKIADGVFLTRDLVSEPGNVLYPAEFAKRCQALKELGVEVEVLSEAQMKKLGMGSLLGVGQGSDRESKLVIMRWNGGKAKQKPVCFVGKGVTFDTGGISLKPSAGMEEMKFDMGGAGAVTGAMAALAGREAKANVVGIIGLVENMPDGKAIRPGDILTSMSGKTIEVLNTDAEGRLVLCDALTYAQQKYKPQVIIDLATLTGAILVSLAREYAGVFCNNDALYGQLEASAKQSGEPVWRMPLGKPYHDMLKSPIADMKNIGGRFGGSSSAAAFLEKFIENETPWAHIDIAGMAWNYTDKPTGPKGGSGYGVRLLDEFVREHYE